MEFYKVLQAIMDEKQMNIPDVARASGLSDSTIRSIVKRKSKTVALEVAAKLSHGLGISLEYFNDGVPHESLDPKEHQIIKKYRVLDEHGKDVVETVLDKEHVRCTRLRTQRNQIRQQTEESHENQYMLQNDSTDADSDIEHQADRVASMAREQFLLEQDKASQASSANVSAAG